MQSICAQQLATEMHSALAIDKAIEFCFLLNQDTYAKPKKWHVPLVLFWSIEQPTQSTSKKLSKSKWDPLGYYKPKFFVLLI